MRIQEMGQIRYRLELILLLALNPLYVGLNVMYSLLYSS